MTPPPSLHSLGFTLPALAAWYAAGGSVEAVAREALRRIAAFADPALFITQVPAETLLAEARRLDTEGARNRPLFGIPYAAKDNIDAADLPTTAGCPAYAYTPTQDAPAIARLRAAGALLLGKTNLDQFATGLNGTRSPYGTPRNAIDPALIPGGSSSGSATAVAAGIASFALGTDTAGSGRVPAMLQNIVGLKPSLGLIPTRGVVPACRSLDCVSIFALTVADAAQLLAILAGPDTADPYSRAAPASWRASPAPRPHWRLAIPDAASRSFDTDADATLYATMLDRAQRLGASLAPVDLTPFLSLAKRLYDGAWVAERTAALRDLVLHQPEALHPVTRGILAAGLAKQTIDAFDDFHALAQTRLLARALFANADALLLPTAPGAPSLAALAAAPIAANSRLGTYTNFVNLLDLAGIAIPAGFTTAGTPFGVTLLGPAFSEASLAALAASLHHAAAPGRLGARAEAPPPPPDALPLGSDETALFCIGAHMSGLPLNHQLTARGGRFLHSASTAPEYRLHDLGNRPGMLRATPGAAIAGEIWALPGGAIGALLGDVPSPLGFGRVRLADGSETLGFLCETAGAAGAPDITAFGGWRRYQAGGC